MLVKYKKTWYDLEKLTNEEKKNMFPELYKESENKAINETFAEVKEAEIKETTKIKYEEVFTEEFVKEIEKTKKKKK